MPKNPDCSDSPTATIGAVTFDLDGTLIDTAADFHQTVRTMCQRRQTPVPTGEAVRAHVSAGARALVSAFFGTASTNPYFDADLEELLSTYADFNGVAATIFPGLDELLQQLEASGIPWGIVTNKPERFALPLLERLNLTTRCSTLICPEHTQERKPHPEPIFKACTDLQVEPRSMLYVGDHARDITAGRAAGAMTAAAGWGYLLPEESARDWEADFDFETSLAFSSWLLKLQQQHDK